MCVVLSHNDDLMVCVLCCLTTMMRGVCVVLSHNDDARVCVVLSHNDDARVCVVLYCLTTMI